jgi:hypothetical protein
MATSSSFGEMPISIPGEQPTLCIRRDAFEGAGLTRADIDDRFALTADDFRMEGELIVIGPLYGAQITDLVTEMEEAGLTYFDDFFELSGNWPEWIQLFVMTPRE